LEAARYGLTVADVQQAVSSGIGGEMVTENIEGRERYPVNVRYNRDFRDNVEELRRVLKGTLNSGIARTGVRFCNTASSVR